MDIDEIYQQIGESGHQQIKYGAALWFLKMYTPFLILQYTIVARDSNFICKSKNISHNNECPGNSVSNCDKIIFTESTINSEWNLVCDRNWLSKSTMSSLMFGFLLGALALGNLSDRIGRKCNMIFNLGGTIFFNLISSMTTQYSVYILSRFFVGFFVSGKILSVVVLMSELVGARYRGIYGILITGAYPFGIVFMSQVAWYIRDWREFTFLVSVMGIPYLVYHWYMVESPRWLINTNRNDEAKAILQYLALGNGVESEKQAFVVKKSAADSVKEYLSDLLNRKHIMKIVYVLAFNWFVNGATYYGLTLAAGDIGTDLYSGLALSGIAELPAIVLSYLAIEKIGRRLALVIFMMVSGVSCMCIQMLQGTSFDHLGITCALLGKLFIAGSFKIAYVISNEIYATSIRNSGLGLLSAAARVGSMLSPFIVMAGETVPGIQFTVFGILSIVGGAMSLALPETKDKPLAETVSEMLLDKSKKINNV